jgi:hypothetical protein
MNSPIDDDKVYEARNFVKNGKDGLQTVLEFREVLQGGDVMVALGGLLPQKSIFRGRGEALVKVPAFNGQPAREMRQPVDFKIEAKDLQEAFAGYDTGLQRAQKELQEDVEKQVSAMNVRGIFKPG